MWILRLDSCIVAEWSNFDKYDFILEFWSINLSSLLYNVMLFVIGKKNINFVVKFLYRN